jgi:RNA polymerase sigma-70 factor (ECF subfamily)
MGVQGNDDKNLIFQNIIDHHQGQLLGIAQKILYGTGEAEDVVQSTLTQVWKHRNEVPAEKLERYLFKAVRLNALKYRARLRRGCSLEDICEQEARADSDGESLNEIDPFILEEALSGLPETQQAVLRMKYYTDLTFREIGKILTISANTAASRCRYALENLRKKLMNHRGGES